MAWQDNDVIDTEGGGRGNGNRDGLCNDTGQRRSHDTGLPARRTFEMQVARALSSVDNDFECWSTKNPNRFWREGITL